MNWNVLFLNSILKIQAFCSATSQRAVSTPTWPNRWLKQWKTLPWTERQSFARFISRLAKYLACSTTCTCCRRVEWPMQAFARKLIASSRGLFFFLRKNQNSNFSFLHHNHNEFNFIYIKQLETKMSSHSQSGRLLHRAVGHCANRSRELSWTHQGINYIFLLILFFIF